MKVLIVEDDENTIALFEGELPPTGPCAATFARSRDSALSGLKAGSFDLVILDLKIPAQDGSLDSDINHGLDVHSYVQEFAPGTPIIVFSAYGTLKLAARLAENSARHDVWGCTQEQAMTVFREKSDLADCLSELQNVIGHVASLSAIAISTGGQEVNLTHEHKRILRIYARIHQGVNVCVSPLGGGYSDAKTIRLEVHDQHSAATSLAVVKMGTISSLKDEESRYHRCIAPALSVGGFAHLIRFVSAGAANVGGIFYGLAKDYRQTLTEVLASTPDQATATIPELQRLETTWQTNAINKSMTVGDIRRCLINDESFLPIADTLGFDWRAFEQNQIRAKWCCQHRDLHGLNILVRDGEVPLLIDYGEVEQAPACLDPLVLELSLLFHRGCKHVRGSWPTNEQALAWQSLDAYLSAIPIAPFVRACRAWAHAVEPVDRAVYATAYAYAVRQLKFTDTDHDLARSIARAAQTAFAAN